MQHYNFQLCHAQPLRLGEHNTWRAISSPARLQVATHEFDFDKLEFARPSRMNKVFILFSTQIADVDILFTIFEVPTVCFCRREQKERAYAKLGVPYRMSVPAGGVKADPDKKVRRLPLCCAALCCASVYLPQSNGTASTWIQVQFMSLACVLLQSRR